MPQTWTSDDTDAIERLKIQEGTSLVYPTSSMGVTFQQFLIIKCIELRHFDTRGVVAMAGSFGYELDVTKMSDEEEEGSKSHKLNSIRRLDIQFNLEIYID